MADTNTAETREYIRNLLLQAGACRVGFAHAEAVAEDDKARYEDWLGANLNGPLGYMHNHPILRFDPGMLLPGAQTVISLAFNYNPGGDIDAGIARFAQGEDYHKALRRRLKPVCRRLEQELECRTRICIDSAPVREKYWAFRSGVAFCGRNGLAIVPGIGSFVFLAEILTDLTIEPDSPLAMSCSECGECQRACPTGALRSDGLVNANRCLSCLTIEHKGEWPEDIPNELRMQTLYGCDRCQLCCPHNRDIPPGLPEFRKGAPPTARFSR